MSYGIKTIVLKKIVESEVHEMNARKCILQALDTKYCCIYTKW